MDGVGPAEDLRLLPGDPAGDADGEAGAGAGEGMADDERGSSRVIFFGSIQCIFLHQDS